MHVSLSTSKLVEQNNTKKYRGTPSQRPSRSGHHAASLRGEDSPVLGRRQFTLHQRKSSLCPPFGELEETHSKRISRHTMGGPQWVAENLCPPKKGVLLAKPPRPVQKDLSYLPTRQGWTKQNCGTTRTSTSPVPTVGKYFSRFHHTPLQGRRNGVHLGHHWQILQICHIYPNPQVMLGWSDRTIIFPTRSHVVGHSH